MKKSPPTRVETSLVMDNKTGQILHSSNAHVEIYPASTTKMMTLYLLFDAVKSGKLSLNDKLYVSQNATNMKPCKLGLKEGEYITVRDVALALIVKSANDAAVVAAEALSKSEQHFAHQMNKKARSLGMTRSNFTNASGWHDPSQKTTAYDLALLAAKLKSDFPSFYPLFSATSFNFRGKTITGHNKVTQSYHGAEGMKTGYTGPAGFNLVTTASRGNKSLVAVVTGSHTAKTRDNLMMRLLDKHFGVVNNYKKPQKSLHPLKKGMAKVAKKSIARATKHNKKIHKKSA